MTRLRLFFLVAALAAPLSARAQAEATGTAAARVVRPIAVRQLADLDFGLITASSAQSGSVTIVPGAQAARYSGSAQAACLAASGCAASHSASFEVTGEANRAYTISAPASVVIGAGRLETSALRVGEISVRSASRPDDGPAGRLDQSGRDSFELGGTLHLQGPLPAAHYRVSIAVIVTYS